MACTGCNDGCLDSIGLAEGPQGLFGGFSGEWLFSTGTTSTQSAGKLAFNNANIASTTAIYVNKTNIDNKDLSLFLASFSNSSNYGLLRVFKEDDNSKFWYGTLTAIAGPTSNVYTLTVTTILTSFSSGTFTANDNVVITFSPKGPAASIGTSLLYSSYSNSGTTNGVNSEALKTYPLTVSTLAVDGNIIEVEAVVDGIGDSTSSAYQVQLQFDGNSLNTVTTGSLTATNSRSVHLKAIIVRTGTASERIIGETRLTAGSSNGSLIGNGNSLSLVYSGNKDFTVALDSGTKDITVVVSRTTGNFTASQFTCRSLTVKHIKQ
jgi:hypothetical protein